MWSGCVGCVFGVWFIFVGGRDSYFFGVVESRVVEEEEDGEVIIYVVGVEGSERSIFL